MSGEDELDGLYRQLCQVLSAVGEQRATLFLARFALLASREIDDLTRVRELLVQARAAEGDELPR